jgi:hypothetical protein
MESHTLVEEFSILVSGALEHHLVGLNLLVGLCDNYNMNCLESVLVDASVKSSHQAQIVYWLFDVGHEVFILVMNTTRVGIIDKLPIVQSVSICVVQQGLSVSNSVSHCFERYSELLWQEVHSNAVVSGGFVVLVASFQEVSG